jgi:hypothetical protein
VAAVLDLVTGPGAVDLTGPGAVDLTGPGAVDLTGPTTVDPTGPGAVDLTGTGQRCDWGATGITSRFCVWAFVPYLPPPVRSTHTGPYRTTLNIIPHVRGSCQ